MKRLFLILTIIVSTGAFTPIIEDYDLVRRYMEATDWVDDVSSFYNYFIRSIESVVKNQKELTDKEKNILQEAKTILNSIDLLEIENKASDIAGKWNLTALHMEICPNRPVYKPFFHRHIALDHNGQCPQKKYKTLVEHVQAMVHHYSYLIEPKLKEAKKIPESEIQELLDLLDPEKILRKFENNAVEAAKILQEIDWFWPKKCNFVLGRCAYKGKRKFVCLIYYEPKSKWSKTYDNYYEAYKGEGRIVIPPDF